MLLWLLASAVAAGVYCSDCSTGVFPEFAMMNHSCVPNTAAPVLLPSRLLVRSAVQVPTGEELTTSYLGLAGGVPMQQRQQLLQQHYNFTCACQRCKVCEQCKFA
eukprot:GHRR01027599.1.p2 GENE.GHRR01027599.1~~GHRR01027599.1.p2  ORF type:complete len:105 (+),score=29.28 GHRR01027599.1:59-373(+)